MLKLENSIRGLSFRRGAFDLTIQGIKKAPLRVLFFCMERAKGIEPSSQAWEARILPMNYARV